MKCWVLILNTGNDSRVALVWQDAIPTEEERSKAFSNVKGRLKRIHCFGPFSPPEISKDEQTYDPSDVKVVHLQQEDFEKLEDWMGDGKAVGELDKKLQGIILRRQE